MADYKGKVTNIIKNRTVNHGQLPQDLEKNGNLPTFSFVVGADTQLGIASSNQEWETEIKYSVEAVKYINKLNPKPAFVTLCGDLVDMEAGIFTGVGFTKEECLDIQAKQWDDFLRVWSGLDDDIPLLCMCGNHDVGNAPTAESIERYTNAIGDDYYAFWYNRCYFICLNTNVYNDNTHCLDQYNAQNAWLENCLKSAKRKKPRRIFLFGHHPWFFSNENESSNDLVGRNHFPEPSRADKSIPDSYFFIKPDKRKFVMDLCKKYKVDACFAGHYHQNLVSETTWGMPMITTGPICNWILNSTAKTVQNADNETLRGGIRVVRVGDQFNKGFSHCYECIPTTVKKSNEKKDSNAISTSKTKGNGSSSAVLSPAATRKRKLT